MFYLLKNLPDQIVAYSKDNLYANYEGENFTLSTLNKNNFLEMCSQKIC